MPIPFTCPHCGHQVMVADQYIGQTGPCGRCGQMVTIGGMQSFGTSLPPPKPKKGGGPGVGLILAIVGGVLLLLMLTCVGALFFIGRSATVAVTSAQNASGRALCMNNLKQIALAMHNYNDVYGSFPPAYLADANGKPMHSWRVLILPFLGHNTVYQQYRFDEPWDSPTNVSLAAMIPSQYLCPDEMEGTLMTHYMVVSGPGAPFEGDKPAKFSSFIDGLSTTLLVVESTTSTNWMAPTDLDFSKMSFVLNDTSAPAVGSPHEMGANVALGDGAVRFLTPAETSPETLKAMLTRGGGEAVLY